MPSFRRRNTAKIAETIETYRDAVRNRLSPAERGETFKVPRLMTEIQGQLAFADTDVFMESHNWSLLNHPARLDEHEFTIRETAHGFEIDLDGNRLTYRFAGEQEQLSLDVHVEGWTQEGAGPVARPEGASTRRRSGRTGQVAVQSRHSPAQHSRPARLRAHALQVHPGSKDTRQN